MRTALLLILLIVARVPALADVKLPAVISDHMVLQADKPVAIWGWADPDESVAISFGDEKCSWENSRPAQGRKRS
jgi:sialate O-acetylesterase